MPYSAKAVEDLMQEVKTLIDSFPSYWETEPDDWRWFLKNADITSLSAAVQRLERERGRE